MNRIYLYAMAVAFTAMALVPHLATSSEAHSGYSAETLKGRWGSTEEWETGGQYHTSIGVYRFDGRGGCTLRYVVSDPTQTGTNDWEETSCTYEVAPDGRGQLRGGVTPAEFVVTDHGQRIEFVFNSPSVVGRGQMTRM